MDLLSDELRSSYGNATDVVLGAKNKQKKEPNPRRKKMSKAQEKKLRQMKEKKERIAKSKLLMQSISSMALKDEEKQLMTSSSAIGKKRTLKQQIRRSFLLDRAGVQSDTSHITIFEPRADSKITVDSSNISEEEDVSNPRHNASVQMDTFVGAPVIQVRDKLKRKRKIIFQSEEKEQQSEQAIKELTEEQKTYKAYIDALAKEEFENRERQPIAEHIPRATLQSFFVKIVRDPVIQAAREQLPIYAEEQAIIEMIRTHPFTILCGATGSGKTTQVPQFLYENGYSFAKHGHPGLIGVTQPRRVAAISTSQRVLRELGDVPPQTVGYQVRYDRHVDDGATRIKFMTDGLLLKELEQDQLLLKYSIVLIDEAHERNLNTDVLIGLLSRLLPTRNSRPNTPPLRVVIMSATLRVADFTQNKLLFPDAPPPVLEVPARQFPVTTFFNRRTELRDYLADVLAKVTKIHTNLPAGSILVFLTGRREIETLCAQLKETLTEEAVDETTDELVDDEDVDFALVDAGEDVEGFDEPENAAEERTSKKPTVPGVRILPLYSLLPPEEQLRCFEEVDPAKVRTIVVATNVAETSITIPGVKYVVDCGREKRKEFDPVSGTSCFTVDWISKASADQRTGRAGRVGPGYCYRLYSSAVFDNYFDQFSLPEVLQTPMENIMLRMKAMGIKDIAAFPFPTAPDAEAVAAAETRLLRLGAVNKERELTPLGRVLAQFPVNPRYAKILALGHQAACVGPMIALVAALSIDNLFQMKAKIAPFQDPVSDALTLYRVVAAYQKAGNKRQYCEENGLRVKSMDEVQKLRIQLTNIVRDVETAREQHPEEDTPLLTDDSLTLPDITPKRASLWTSIITSGFIDQVARKWPKDLVLEGIGRVEPGAYQCMSSQDPVFIHPNSTLFPAGKQPEYVVYQELIQSKKTYLKGVTQANPKQLFALAKGDAAAVPGYVGALLAVHTLADSSPVYDEEKDHIMIRVGVSFGPHQWTLPTQLIPCPSSSLYAAFLRLLLEGRILPLLKPLRAAWPPSAPPFPAPPRHRLPLRPHRRLARPRDPSVGPPAAPGPPRLEAYPRPGLGPVPSCIMEDSAFLAVDADAFPVRNDRIAEPHDRKCLIIYTGGTIAMTKRPGDGALAPVRGFLTELIPQLFEFQHKMMPRYDILEWETLLDSSDFDPTDWARLARQIRDHYWDYNGFVILHGTDTLAYTASALSFMLENLSKPVILTGSLIPLAEVYNDAKRNLVLAVIIASFFDIPEVTVCFNGFLFRGNRSSKVDNFGVNAFHSPNYPIIGILGAGLRLNAHRIRPQPQYQFSIQTQLFTRVTVIHLVPGYDDSMLLDYAKGSSEPRGLVMRLYGTGNAPSKKASFIESLRTAMEYNVEIVVTSQCARGPVRLQSYVTGRSLLDLNVINGHDMTTEACVTKLSYLMGLGFRGQRLKSMMESNLRGELTERSSTFTYDNTSKL